MIERAILEVTNSEGEVIHKENFKNEDAASYEMDEMAEIRDPLTYHGMRMNLSEWPGDGRIGSVRLIAVDYNDVRYVRRELFRCDIK